MPSLHCTGIRQVSANCTRTRPAYRLAHLYVRHQDEKVQGVLPKSDILTTLPVISSSYFANCRSTPPQQAKRRHKCEWPQCNSWHPGSSTHDGQKQCYIVWKQRDHSTAPTHEKNCCVRQPPPRPPLLHKLWKQSKSTTTKLKLLSKAFLYQEAGGTSTFTISLSSSCKQLQLCRNFRVSLQTSFSSPEYPRSCAPKSSEAPHMQRHNPRCQGQEPV